MPDFRHFHNADLTLTRSQGNRTAAGYERAGTETILQCRADAQESGRSLVRAQQLYEAGDLLVFAREPVTTVEPGDDVTIDHDDGRRLEGSVVEVIPLDNSLLVRL